MVLGRLGIAHPIPNSRWNRMSSFSGDAYEAAYDATRFDVDLTKIVGMPDTCNKLLGYTIGGDVTQGYAGFGLLRVLMGPSSHASYLGKVEEFVLLGGGTGATASRLLIDGSIANTYQHNDPVTVLSYSLPGGWKGDAPGYDRRGFCFGRIIENSISDMYASPYNFSCISPTNATSNCASIELVPLIANTYYRLEVRYKNNNNGGTYGPAVMVYEKVGGSWSGIGTAYCNVLTNAWSTAYVVFKTSRTAIQKHAIIVAFAIPTTNLNSCHIASISLTQASHDIAASGSGTVYSEDGVSTLIDYPDIGSVTVQRNHIGRKYTYDKFGYPIIEQVAQPPELPVTTYSISYSITGMTSARYEVIRNLLMWQQQGYMINHFPGLQGLPYCLTGKLNADVLCRHRIGNLDLLDIDLCFDEVLI